MARRGASLAMASGSSASRRRGPYIPIISCHDCGRMVLRSVSGTPEHNGWTYYKCQKHGLGCVFWHWEVDYVSYLVGHDYILGDAAVEAIGWAEDRMEELKLRKAESEATGDAGPGAKEEKIIKNIQALVVEVKNVLILMKMLLATLSVLLVLVMLKK